MIINLTLLIQIFHFFIAYFVISKFLLKPALNALKDDAHEKSLLKESVIHEQHNLNIKKDFEITQWKNYLNNFNLHKPNIQNIPVVNISAINNMKDFPILKENELQKLADQIALELKLKVIHD